MAEPTTTTTAVGWAVAAGSMSAFFAAIGVPWSFVFWGFLGGLFGLSWAPQVGRVRSILMFPASAFLAGKIGLLAAAQSFSGSPDWAQGIAAIAGIIFHPAIGLFVSSLPTLAKRLGVPTK
jgi:hypothetical protein